MATTVQTNFIELLKRSAPMHISLAEELSELLQISLDSVYRRLRCETDITLSETFAICKHFNIPLKTQWSDLFAHLVVLITASIS